MPAFSSAARAAVPTAGVRSRRSRWLIIIVSWAPAAGDAKPWIALDLGGVREFGGLVVDWAPERGARDYAVELSDDGVVWRLVREIHGGA